MRYKSWWLWSFRPIVFWRS